MIVLTLPILLSIGAWLGLAAVARWDEQHAPRQAGFGPAASEELPG